VAASRGRIVVTGRTDNYLHGRPDLDDTVRRLTAFAEAGADVLYAPYPPDLAAVTTIIKAVSPKPVNVLISPADRVLTVAEVQAAGAGRISLGVALYAQAMGALQQSATALAAGDLASATSGMAFGELSRLLGQAKG
jgi:2-methylisocitrate lyase-like PEP mutase family enzyme